MFERRGIQRDVATIVGVSNITRLAGDSC